MLDLFSIEDQQRLEYSLELYGIVYLALLYQENSELNQEVIENVIKKEDAATLLFAIFDRYKDNIKQISTEFTEKELNSIIFHNNVETAPKSKAYAVTPDYISKLTIKLLDVQQSDVLFDFGSGLGDFLLEVHNKHKCQKLYGIDLDVEANLVATIRHSLLQSDVEILTGNFLEKTYDSYNIDKIFIHPAFGMIRDDTDEHNQNTLKLFGETVSFKNSVWTYILAALANLNQEGKVVCITTNNATFNLSDFEIRKMLVEKGYLESVISLPKGLFYEIPLSVSIFIMSHGNQKIRMINAEDIYTEGRRYNSLSETDIEQIVIASMKDTEISETISHEDLAQYDYSLNPAMYIVDYEIQNSITFGEIAKQITRGAGINKAELDALTTTEKTGYHYLMLQDIEDGIINSKLPAISSIEEKYSKHLIKNNNLLISKNAPFKIATAEINMNEQIVATGNLYCIEIDQDKINPIYVEAYLQSDLGNAELSRLSKGGAFDTISISNLKKVRIPNISREQQDQIANKFQGLKTEQETTRKKLERIIENKSEIWSYVKKKYKLNKQKTMLPSFVSIPAYPRIALAINNCSDYGF
ncbi:MAG TPA: N-6 DNA methylase [Dysgonamonadaceae bacterium]|nr:N-6 DNA methylase [Dysgonamonadaceae bacterium]